MRRPSFWGLILLTVAVALSGPGVRLLTDAWWFTSVERADVFSTVLLTQIVLALSAGLVAVAIVGGSTRFAARASGASGKPRVVGPLASVERRGNPFATTSPIAIADAVTALIALVSGAAAASAWPDVLLFYYGGSFDWVEPVWNLDAGFYVFDLGLFLGAVHWLSFVLLAAIVVSGGTYIALGTVRVQLVQQDGQLVAQGVVMPPEVQRHLASLLAAVLASLAILSYLNRYAALYESSGLHAGPGYADLYATLPLLTVEAVGTAIAAFGAVVAVSRGSYVGLGAVLAGVAILKGLTVGVPAMVQRFSVLPNELSREAPQILDHIAGTRRGFALDEITEFELSGKAELTRDVIERNKATVENVRLWDHSPLLAAFSQVQEIRTYYGFVSVDNDRYVIDGETRQIMMSPRELTVDALQEQARTWVNQTLIYTHGYGVALGPVNEVGTQGLPELWVQDLPPKVTKHEEVFRIDRPEIYFGEDTRHVVIVGTKNAEFDYPSGDDNAYTRYSGADGVKLGRFGRLLFAARLGSTEVLLSGDLSAESRVLLYRNILDRVHRVAPFFHYDGDPYLVIHEGRLVWILDAYTTSQRFPYATAIRGVGNYLRHPVKVTVDAYDGTMTFYRLDVVDPIADAWDAIFPELFVPIAEMPASLRAHLRYPIDLFNAQAELFATYHMQDHQVFYNREDEWDVPAVDKRRMSPYFTVMRLPGETQEEFILMLPFSPRGKPNLAAWMVGRSDGEFYGQLRVYKFPKDAMVYGPGMVVARVNQDDAISEKLSLWNQQGSNVEWGTLLVIPIEESLIYVQPLYLRAATGSIPELKRVIVAYEDRIAMSDTLEEGLDKLFGTAARASKPSDPSDPNSPLMMPAITTVELIKQAGNHWDAAQEALKLGDWAAYGEHTTELGELLGMLRSGLGKGGTQ